MRWWVDITRPHGILGISSTANWPISGSGSESCPKNEPGLHVADLLVLRGYGDWRNSPSQTIFHCRWCSHAKQADVNAARNIG